MPSPLPSICSPVAERAEVSTTIVMSAKNGRTESGENVSSELPCAQENAPVAAGVTRNAFITEAMSICLEKEMVTGRSGRTAVSPSTGLVLMTVPFVWDEHEQPHDYTRYSSFGLISILDRHGFEVLELRKSVDDIRIVFQLLNAYIHKKTQTRFKLLNLLLTILLMSSYPIVS